MEDEVKSLGINSFTESVNYGHKVGIFSDAALDFVNKHKDVLNAIVDDERSKGFEYFGLRTVYDRYLVKRPYFKKSS